MRKSLGRGILELIGEDETHDAIPLESRNKTVISADMLRPGKFQPRKKFSQESLDNMTKSILRNGLIQPIVVRKSRDGEWYEIIAGERRWRAAIAASLKEIPVIVREISDKECLEIATIENVHREDLTVLEEAAAYSRLIEEFQYTHEDLSRMLGKSRSHISNILRMLTLPASIKSLLDEGLISFGHARCLLNVENPEEIAKRILSDNLSVRETELAASNSLKKRNTTRSSSSNATVLKIKNFLPKQLNTEARLTKNKNRVTITFRNEKSCEKFFSIISGI